MYEPYTRQSLPSAKYRELLGSAICVFNSNNSFIIENILNHDRLDKYTWHDLIDYTSGDLSTPIKDTITKASNTDISNLFYEIVRKRNRIIHSFQITDGSEQRLATKHKQSGKQYIITEQLLLDFIKENENLAIMLHNFRGY